MKRFFELFCKVFPITLYFCVAVVCFFYPLCAATVGSALWLCSYIITLPIGIACCMKIFEDVDKMVKEYKY